MVLRNAKSLSRATLNAALFGSVSVAAMLMTAPGTYAKPLGGARRRRW